VDTSDCISIVLEASFEADCKKLCSDMRVMDDHLRACDYLITRAPAKGIEIPVIPETDVRVFRLDGCSNGAHDIPPTRIFFRYVGEKAHLLAIEAIPEAEYLGLDFDDEDSDDD